MKKISYFFLRLGPNPVPTFIYSKFYDTAPLWVNIYCASLKCVGGLRERKWIKIWYFLWMLVFNLCLKYSSCLSAHLHRNCSSSAALRTNLKSDLLNLVALPHCCGGKELKRWPSKCAQSEGEVLASLVWAGTIQPSAPKIKLSLGDCSCVRNS